MKVQKNAIGNNQYRYLLLDNEFNVIEPVKRYLKFLDNKDMAESTLKNYAYHLKAYFEYLNEIGLSYQRSVSYIIHYSFINLVNSNTIFIGKLFCL